MKTIDEVNEHTHHDLIMLLINTFIKDVSNTTITPTGQVIDLLLDIRNLASEWDSSTNTLD